MHIGASPHPIATTLRRVLRGAAYRGKDTHPTVGGSLTTRDRDRAGNHEQGAPPGVPGTQLCRYDASANRRAAHNYATWHSTGSALPDTSPGSEGGRRRASRVPGLSEVGKSTDSPTSSCLASPPIAYPQARGSSDRAARATLGRLRREPRRPRRPGFIESRAASGAASAPAATALSASRDGKICFRNA